MYPSLMTMHFSCGKTRIQYLACTGSQPPAMSILMPYQGEHQGLVALQVSDEPSHVLVELDMRDIEKTLGLVIVTNEMYA